MTEQIKIDFERTPSPQSPPLKGGEEKYAPSPLRGEGKGEGELTALERAVLSLIQRGRENAISMPALAEAVGITTRELQQIIQHLINDHGVLIASATGRNHGYYYPQSEDEYRAAAAQLEHRIISLARRLRAMDREKYEEIFGQGRIFVDEEEVRG